MIKYNAKNERIKREYFEYQREARQKSIATVDNIRKAIDRYEKYTDYKDFKTFNKRQAVGFKKSFSQTKGVASKDYLSKSTLLSTVRNLKDFFGWVAYQPGYKNIDIRDIEYLNLSEKDTRIAKSKKQPKVPTIDQIRKVLNCMPYKTDIEKRNRALIAFTILTGVRDGAIASLKIKHIDVEEKIVKQMPDQVKTKFSKTIYTYFFPVGGDIEQIVVDWILYLKKELFFDEEAPLFPRTRLTVSSENCFTASGLEPVHWQSANQIRKIFKVEFINAGLSYYSPHCFRNTITRLGERLCKSAEDFKAWSQNLGHESPSTTFTSYGYIETHTQGKIIKEIGTSEKKSTDEKLEEILARLPKQELL
ncbi:MAG: site-specific integrase [Candidatus Theseobacter exili]|nr:site-specific integrase [Candidatus Theseobacter exili]